MFGDNIWCVKVNGVIYKRDLSRKQAETLAERHQRGLCKHRDFRDHVEVFRDKDLIKDVDAMYLEAKAGRMQKYVTQEWRED